MAHSDLVHVKQEGDTCQPLRGPDHNISVYEGQWTWSWIWVTILWNATSNWIFRLTLVEAQAAGAEWPRLSRPEGFILYAVRNASSFHLEMILLGKGLVQTAAEILQRVLLNNILHVKKTHQRWKFEDVTNKHCQRHNGPEGWVLLTKETSSYTNLDQIPKFKILTKHQHFDQTLTSKSWPNIHFITSPSLSSKILTKLQFQKFRLNFNFKLLAKPCAQSLNKI